MEQQAKTLFDKIWEQHVVLSEPNCPTVLFIDLQLVHEVTSPQAFTGLREKGLRVSHPQRTVATVDHGVPTTPISLGITDMMAAKQIATMEKNSADFGIPLYGFDSPNRGIVHVIGPELGLTRPGMTIVCGDSHTSTHGAFGALAFGIGTSEVEHVLATQCLLQYKPKTYEVRVDGKLSAGVSAKDIILALLSRIGIGGGTGHVFEYCGSAIRSLSMEERMTICNMSIEGGARAGMIAPDDTTFEYIKGRTFTPKGQDWENALAHWRTLPTDEGATYDKSITIDANKLTPMITYGTNPGLGMSITDRIPDPSTIKDLSQRRTIQKALTYMDINPGDALLGKPVDVVFIGSCTNSRLSDLKLAAKLMKGRRVNEDVRMMVVPGSQEVKRQAEHLGLDQIFRNAGAEWRESGCSMCIAMNGDQLQPGQYCVSTSNRNFEGRQGKGGRTFLASPLTAVASAVRGVITDVRTLL
ncbi:MAG: 3-isopropylmalate dehydratase large subunit [Ardenticatenaceae bacterium]